MEVQRSNDEPEDELPQCKIKRNYSCNHCSYFTQNPRFHLTHLRDVHGERIAINKCNLCLYASRHFQKLVRHMKMVHGSAEGITGQSRKRAVVAEIPSATKEQEYCFIPAVPPPQDSVELVAQSVDLSSALEESRNILKDLAVLYFAEEEIGTILTEMEAADNVLLAEIAMEDLSITVKPKSPSSSFLEEVKKASIQESDLKCPCGHVSNCFSEAFVHRRACDKTTEDESETKACQHCTQTYASSAELQNHLINCLQFEMFQKVYGSGCDSRIEQESRAADGGDCDKSKDEIGGKAETKSENNLDRPAEISKQEEAIGPSFKKVFKCPRCSFWASTASRFHVHIVGHLNKKPFKCSLCTYRSNWRWDITKHIRLKGTRNPCHKNARVLINDDAGRRNYTKYNKYLTAIKISEEEAGSGRTKTGEMSEDQGNEPSGTGKILDSDEDGQKMAENDFDKRACYRCRKCPYRHNSRDAVLVHTRLYHLQDSQPLLARETLKGRLTCEPSSPNMNKGFADAINLKQKQSTQGSKADKKSALRDGTNSKDTLVEPNGALEKNAANESGTTTNNPSFSESTTSMASPSSPSASRFTCFGEPEMSEMLKKMMTSSKGDDYIAPERKAPSPFRCGHCHQVSNWKHVIQRHCRLKHSGNIQIEALNRSKDIVKPTYQPIDFGQQRRSQEAHMAKTQASCGDDKSNIPPKGQTDQQLQDSSVTDSDFIMEKPKIPRKSSKQNTPRKETKSPVRLKVSQNKSRSDEKPSQLKPSSSQVNTNESAVGLKTAKGTDENIAVPAVEIKPNPKHPDKASQDPVQDRKRSGRDLSPQRKNKLKSQDVLKDCNDLPKGTTPCVTPAATTPTKVQSVKAKKTVASTENCSRPDNTNNCPYCPFKDECHKTLHRHLQNHIRVSNSRGSHLCEHCDFSTSSMNEFNEHIRLHFEFINRKSSAEFFTSFDKMQLTVIDNFQKGEKKDSIHLKAAEKIQKNESENLTNLRRSRCSTATRKIEMKPASTKTILVNPKTGQVIRRN